MKFIRECNILIFVPSPLFPPCSQGYSLNTSFSNSLKILILTFFVNYTKKVSKEKSPLQINLLNSTENLPSRSPSRPGIWFWLINIIIAPGLVGCLQDLPHANFPWILRKLIWGGNHSSQWYLLLMIIIEIRNKQKKLLQHYIILCL